MGTLRATLAVVLIGLGSDCGAQSPPAPSDVARTAQGAAPPPCRTTALATLPQLFSEEPVDSGAANGPGPAKDPRIANEPAEYLERFFVAIECDQPHTPGDYQIWWKASLASPPNSARLVAILNEQAETCERVFGCFPAGREFDFAIEVNSWRMTPGCYGVKGIFGAAVDEYWQCTRPVVFTLAAPASRNGPP